MDKLWTFEHEPISLDEMIVSNEKRITLRKIINELPTTLIAGNPGTGKGTFMNILLRETEVEFIKINGSDETGIDMVRDKIKSFATGYSLNKKIVYINECMDENEYIRTPTGYLQLKDMEYGVEYDVISFNTKTHKTENDIAIKLSEQEDDIYEVMLEDGRNIKVNMEHKFLVSIDGDIVCKKLCDIQEGDDIIS